MPHALNLCLPLKQDPETKEKLAQLKTDFATTVQGKIDEALRKSEIVHFARVLVVDDRYLMVITEYDGDHGDYTEFFRKELPDVFARLFSLAEGAPAFGQLDRESFFRLAQGLNLRSLGDTTSHSTTGTGEPAGYLFSAYGDSTVKDILPKLRA